VQKNKSKDAKRKTNIAICKKLAILSSYFGQNSGRSEKMNIFSGNFIFIRFYFVKGFWQKIMQFSQVCAKVRKLQISNNFQKCS